MQANAYQSKTDVLLEKKSFDSLLGFALQRIVVLTMVLGFVL